MKITKAIVREVSQTFSTRSFSADKGHDMTYESGILSVRSNDHPGKMFLYPASNVVHMEADEPKKK